MTANAARARTVLRARTVEIVAALLAAGAFVILAAMLQAGAERERESVNRETRIARAALADWTQRVAVVAERASSDRDLRHAMTGATLPGIVVADQPARSYVLSPAIGQAIGRVHGAIVREWPADLSSDIRLLVQDLRGDASAPGIRRFGAVASGHVVVAGRVAIACAARIAGAAEDEYVLLVQPLDADELSRLGASYSLDHLRVTTDPAIGGGPGIALAGLDGSPLASLSWRSADPGGTAVGTTALVVLLGIGALLIILLRDVDHRAGELSHSERRARANAECDPLTGAANRACFFRTVAASAYAARRGQRFALMMLDLDRFKDVNDSFGHQVGDRLLVDVAARLREHAGEDALVARIGGDEFAIVLSGDPSASVAARIGERIVADLARPIVLDGRSVEIGASVGIVLAPEHGAEEAVLVRRADLALYLAKTSGRGRATLYDVEQEKDARHKRFLERELRAAILTGELRLEYQPVFLADGVHPSSVEALVRWRHPLRGLIAPAEFVPLAEDTGLIHRLGAFVLDQACKDAARWPEQAVAVNLSPLQVLKGDLVAEVRGALARHGVVPGRLVLEITENVLLEDSELAIETLNRLRAIGCKVALDDFGTGYSSLGYLKRFAFDKLKIDQSFVRDLGDSADSALIVHSIVSMARGLGMTVIAEGVETPEQLRFLRATGCHELQGYLLGRPMPAAQIDALVAEHASRAALARQA